MKNRNKNIIYLNHKRHFYIFINNIFIFHKKFYRFCLINTRIGMGFKLNQSGFQKSLHIFFIIIITVISNSNKMAFFFFFFFNKAKKYIKIIIEILSNILKQI